MERNEVNELSVGEWINFTRTMFEVNYPLDLTWADRKICKITKSPYILRDVITFFTKGGETVLDPMANVGSTLLAASMCGRSSVGIEENKEYVYAFAKIKEKYGIFHGGIVENEQMGFHDRLLKDAKMHNESIRILEGFRVGQVDFVLTSPESGPGSMENQDEVKEYLRTWRKLSDEIYRILEPGRYFCFFIGDRYVNGEYYNLASEVTQLVRASGFKFKGKRILYNRSKPLNSKAFKVGSSFVPNIEHEELVIMKREGE